MEKQNKNSVSILSIELDVTL